MARSSHEETTMSTTAAPQSVQREVCKPTDAGTPGLQGRRHLGPDWPYLKCAWRRMLSPRTLGRDVMAGIVVAFVALPLSLAFARAAGAEPHTGLVIRLVGGPVRNTPGCTSIL